MALVILGGHGWDGGDDSTAGLEVDGCGCDGVEFLLYFGTFFANPNKRLPLMLQRTEIRKY